MRYERPELTAPAGDWSALKSAAIAGADSVYFGVKDLNMRHQAGNFDVLELGKIMDLLREKGMKGYLTLNVIVFDREMDKVRSILDHAVKAGVDAVILWDMAVLEEARKLGLKVHLSTQASVSNYEALKHYSSLGVKRAVLARECTLSDIKSITKRIGEEKLDLSIETFIHGAMCVSISGRCFMSEDTFGKSANRGECIQPCRREFRITDMDDDTSYVIGRDYVLSPKDLCTVGILDRLIEAGINAFKIEGRIRSPEYVKEVTTVYREAIDAYFDNTLNDDLKNSLYGRLKRMYNRGFSEGFYLGRPDEWVSGRLENEYEKVFLGEVVKFYKKINVAEILIRNEGIRKGQQILINGKTTPASFARVDELEQDHRPVDFAPRGETVAIKLPFTARPKDQAYIWQKKS